MCGWCKDKWGINWQITPRVLIAATTGADKAAAKRAFEAMMTTKTIDIAEIEAAVKGTGDAAILRQSIFLLTVEAAERALRKAYCIRFQHSGTRSTVPGTAVRRERECQYVRIWEGAATI